MNLLEITTLGLSIFSIGISIVFYLEKKQAKVELQKREDEQKQRLYQIAILREVQDKIGYSLDPEKIVDVITGSLKHLFPFSTASSMILKPDKLVFKTYVEQSVNSYFVIRVKKSMLSSLGALKGSLPTHIEEQLLGAPLDEARVAPVTSFFNIPIYVGRNVVGLINISSINRDPYKEEEITILYQVVAQASKALSNLQDVLETEKGKLTAMISSLVDGVFMVDTHKNLLIINDAAKSFLKISSVNPMFTDILSSIGTQYNLLDKIDEALRTNAQVLDKEVEINSKIFRTFITPVQNSQGENINKPIGASILLHDITIEKNINTIKEDFTHMIVHELRAPLTAIKDSSELMIEVFEDKGTLEKEQQKRLLKIIDMQAKSLLEQINQVLDAAKIEAGRFSINEVDSDITKLIDDVIEAFLPQANKKQILITTDMYYPLPKMKFDPIRITQVLNNLISNSLKFTPANGKIVVSVKPDNGFLNVAVTDNGMGIPESDQKDLFSKYYQIRTTPHELAKKGTGLGLYIIKGIVEAHNGLVGVISKPGQGTTIYFTLPFEGEGPRVIQGHIAQNKANQASALVN